MPRPETDGESTESAPLPESASRNSTDVPSDQNSEQWLVTAALMLAMTVAALEQTVVSTAMPRIIAELGGGEIYPWVFSAYLLAATVSTPIYGKLADLWGRRRLLLFGLALFSLGSILSGLAQSMPQLILMRVIQGLGAGAVMPIVLTLLGDLYTLEQRAKVQGWFSGVWGVSSVAGPALGGVLTDQLSWRWVFFVTVPFGVMAAYVLVAHFQENVQRREIKPIDWQGSTLLALGTTTLLLAVLNGPGRSWEISAVLLALAIMSLAGFLAWQRRAPDPVLPLELLRDGPIIASILGGFMIGLLLFGLDTYIPLYVQGVLGRTATEAGKVITPLFLSWSISVAVAAKVVVRFGFRSSAVVGTCLIAAGMLAIVVGASMPAWAGPIFVAGMLVIGLGMGPTSLSYILAVQNAVSWNRRGVATGLLAFFRTIGGALGVALLGAALGLELSHRIAGTTDVAIALRPESLKSFGPEALQTVRLALGSSLRDVFLLMLATTLLGLACAMPLPTGTARNAPVKDESETLNSEPISAPVLTET